MHTFRRIPAGARHPYLSQLALLAVACLLAGKGAAAGASLPTEVAQRFTGLEPFSIRAEIDYQTGTQPRQRFHWELVVEAPGSFLYTLQEILPSGAEGAGEVVWSDGGAVRTWTAAGAVAEVESAIAPLVRRFGAGAEQAFPHLLWATLGTAVWPQPQRLSVPGIDGREEWRIQSPGRDDGVVFLVEVSGTPRLLQAHWSRDRAQAEFAAAARRAGLKPPPVWGGDAALTVRWREGDPEALVARLGGDSAGAGEELLELVDPGEFDPESLSPEQRRRRGLSPEAAFAEVIRVVGSSITVQPTDSRGRVLRGLGLEDFKLTVGDVTVPVESVQWQGEEGTGAVEGRRVVILLQHPLGWQEQGAAVLLWMIKKSRAMLASLAPEDRVAVVSLSRSPWLWLDFTADREAVAAALRAGLLEGAPPPAGASAASAASAAPSDTLAPLARGTAARLPEVEILRRVARALKPLPGEASILYLGWGFRDQPRQTFEEAVTALAREDIPVQIVTPFATRPLDTLARVTGGNLLRFTPYLHEDVQSMGLVSQRVAESFRGRYELSFTVPDLEAAAPLEVRLVGGGGTVQHARVWLGPPER